MTEEQKERLFYGIKYLAFEDAKQIDSIAKSLNISQKIIYSLFIEYHELMFSRLYKEVDDGT
jgi:hypothetical protein